MWTFHTVVLFGDVFYRYTNRGGFRGVLVVPEHP